METRLEEPKSQINHGKVLSKFVNFKTCYDNHRRKIPDDRVSTKDRHANRDLGNMRKLVKASNTWGSWTGESWWTWWARWSFRSRFENLRFKKGSKFRNNFTYRAVLKVIIKIAKTYFQVTVKGLRV